MESGRNRGIESSLLSFEICWGHLNIVARDVVHFACTGEFILRGPSRPYTENDAHVTNMWPMPLYFVDAVRGVALYRIVLTRVVVHLYPIIDLGQRTLLMQYGLFNSSGIALSLRHRCETYKKYNPYKVIYFDMEEANISMCHY